MLARFAIIMAGLRDAVAAHIARDRTAGPWIVAVWQHLRRVAAGVERIAAQIQAGTVPPLRSGFKLTKPRKPPTRPAIVLANHSFWLCAAIPQTVAYGSFLRQWLDAPEMAAMLAAAPQLARILRPLCRALGVEPPPLPPRPQPPAAPAQQPPDSAMPVATGSPAPARRGRPHSPRARPVYVWPAPHLAGHVQKPA